MSTLAPAMPRQWFLIKIDRIDWIDTNVKDLELNWHNCNRLSKMDRSDQRVWSGSRGHQSPVLQVGTNVQAIRFLVQVGNPLIFIFIF